jgi:anti-sigma regulatory factor (Ser/Thr protein kinase)
VAARPPVPAGSLRVLLAGGRREVRRLNDSVARFLWERGVPPDRLHDVQLVVEELVTNVLRHGVPQDGPHRVALEIDVAGDVIRLAVEDNCQEFDPTAAIPPSLGSSLEDRPTGSYGLRIVRRLVNGLTYRRLPAGNRVEATIPLDGPASI